MFSISREELINNLKKLRRTLCGYTGENYCDCKYGCSNEGEETGCAELRLTIQILEQIPEDYFKYLLDKR